MSKICIGTLKSTKALTFLIINILRFDKKKSLEILQPLKGTYLEMIKRQDIPESLTIESPKNSANLLAVLIEVDF